MLRTALRLPKRSVLGPGFAYRSSPRATPSAFPTQLRLSSSHNHPPNSPKESEEQRQNAEPPAEQQQPQQPAREPQDASQLQLEAVKERLRSWSEHASLQLRQRADDWTARVATTFSHLGSELNKVTGYGEIEALKRRVVEQEARIHATRQAAREAKEAYDKAVLQRASSQREVNDLLQRKSHWTDEDVSRFTALVRQDHVYEQAEMRAKEVAAQCEDAVEREFSELMRVILNRYHEEQAWSDKIRSASTYGSLAAMGLNVLVFVLAIILVEPWKRRRLAQTFERKVEQMSAENVAVLDAKTTELVQRLDRQDKLLADILEGQYYANHLPSEDLARINAEVATQPERQHKRTPPLLTSERDLALALAGSATAAAVLGWIARSLYG